MVLTKDVDELVMSGVQQSFKLNAMIEAGDLDDTRRTVVAAYPGNQQAAMGYALELVERVEDYGLDAEREYLRDLPAGHGHLIATHIEGGHPEWDASDFTEMELTT